MGRMQLWLLGGALLLATTGAPACSSSGPSEHGEGAGAAGSSATGEGAGADSSSGGGTSTGGGTSGDGSGAGSNGGTSTSGGGDGGTTSSVSAFTLSQSGDVYVYSRDSASMTIDPSDGGRIVSFVVDGVETLTQQGTAAQYGSVFWPSPQSLWDWPPPEEIDSQAYSVAVDGNTLTLTSPEASSLDMVVEKTHSPVVTSNGNPGISVTYTTKNVGTGTISAAPWEISRVTSGMTFYPTGPAGQLSSSTLAVQEIGDHTWYTYDASGFQQGDVPKSFGDGKDGWIAWTTTGALVVKSFPDIGSSAFAPDEAEIELYAAPSGEYMEVEQQGAYVDIQAGASSSWTVVWTGTSVPDGTNTAAGSSELVSLVLGAR